MQPARILVPPQLLSLPCALNSISSRNLHAILGLPGELRPLALRSFSSLAYYQQLNSLGDNAPLADSFPPNSTPSGQIFRYGGLLKEGQKEAVSDNGASDSRLFKTRIRTHPTRKEPRLNRVSPKVPDSGGERPQKDEGIRVQEGSTVTLIRKFPASSALSHSRKRNSQPHDGVSPHSQTVKETPPLVDIAELGRAKFRHALRSLEHRLALQSREEAETKASILALKTALRTKSVPEQEAVLLEKQQKLELLERSNRHGQERVMRMRKHRGLAKSAPVQSKFAEYVKKQLLRTQHAIKPLSDAMVPCQALMLCFNEEQARLQNAVHENGIWLQEWQAKYRESREPRDEELYAEKIQTVKKQETRLVELRARSKNALKFVQSVHESGSKISDPDTGSREALIAVYDEQMDRLLGFLFECKRILDNPFNDSDEGLMRFARSHYLDVIDVEDVKKRLNETKKLKQQRWQEVMATVVQLRSEILHLFGLADCSSDVWVENPKPMGGTRKPPLESSELQTQTSPEKSEHCLIDGKTTIANTKSPSNGAANAVTARTSGAESRITPAATTAPNADDLTLSLEQKVKDALNTDKKITSYEQTLAGWLREIKTLDAKIKRAVKDNSPDLQLLNLKRQVKQDAAEVVRKAMEQLLRELAASGTAVSQDSTGSASKQDLAFHINNEGGTATSGMIPFKQDKRAQKQEPINGRKAAAENDSAHTKSAELVRNIIYGADSDSLERRLQTQELRDKARRLALKSSTHQAEQREIASLIRAVPSSNRLEGKLELKGSYELENSQQQSLGKTIDEEESRLPIGNDATVNANEPTATRKDDVESELPRHSSLHQLPPENMLTMMEPDHYPVWGFSDSPYMLDLQGNQSSIEPMHEGSPVPHTASPQETQELRKPSYSAAQLAGLAGAEIIQAADLMAPNCDAVIERYEETRAALHKEPNDLNTASSAEQPSPSPPLVRAITSKDPEGYRSSNRNAAMKPHEEVNGALRRIPHQSEPPALAKEPFASSSLAMRHYDPRASERRPPKRSENNWGHSTFKELKAQVAELKTLVLNLASQKTSMAPEPSIFERNPVKAADDSYSNGSGAASLLQKPLDSAEGEPVVHVQAQRNGSSHANGLRRSPQPVNSSAMLGSLSPNSESPDEAESESQGPTTSTQSAQSEGTADFTPPEKAGTVPAASASALLEELFPDEAARSPSVDVTESERSLATVDINESENIVPRLPLPSEKKPRSYIRRKDSGALGPIAVDRNVMTVLELHTANVSLTKEDFRRLTPRGKHMKEWSVGGEFAKVFPRRNPWTLEREPPGNYFIVFPDGASAQSYLDHIHHVHNLAKQHTPSSLASPIPPPPGYLIDGEDVHALIQSFTLIAPSLHLLISRYSIGPGYHKFKADLFKRGGYPEIAGDEWIDVPQVLFCTTNGPPPTYYEIIESIGKTGIERNLHWGLIESPDRLRKLEMDRYARTKVETGEECQDEEHAERMERWQNPDMGQKWILSFQNQEEAKSFVRWWHRRPFPWRGKRDPSLDETSKYGMRVTMVEAELLW